MSFDAPEVTFEHIGSQVMRELHRRLATPELAADLPGTLLMKVASDYVKHLEKRNEIEQAKLEKENEDPLTVVLQDGLPFDMRFEVLTEYLDTLEDAWRSASEVMEKMLEEVKLRDDDGVLPDVQELVSEDGGVPELRDGSEVQQDSGDGEAE